MILEPENLRLPTVSGERIEIILNWSKEAAGEYLKMRIDDDQEIIIPRSSFSKVAMVMATEEEQIAMVPTKKTTVRHLSKTVTIGLKRDMRKGEEITIPVHFDIPLNGDLPIITP